MRRISSGGLLLAAGLALIGGVLLWNALLVESARNLPPWEPVNERLEASLQAVNGSGGEAPGSGSGSSSGADGAKDSGTNSEANRGTKNGTNSSASSGADSDAGSGANGGADGANSGDRGIAEDAGAAGVSPAQTTGPPAAAAADNRLDLNRASAEQLQELPGIGPAKAKAIVEDRQQNGFYRSVDEITRVKGIGPKMLAKMRPLVTAVP
ncbi:helix-hairpin-helix domain-containing protein [Paenibacillus sambharensis]|uniref:Helix-hairpin-helix domain-containing protein n=1 Tax=Paenibacillus sambharensis TaxID=1803190 RepID=A0A2W1LFZ9_9BACL|nr:ComEA family DNA-binding protein [Paenibacillus sambharensis]PZD93972.1 helix-hairpin-helix domain-containing protein [Paenibacillus sambharensis]